ncbi:hypothetical protein N8Z10_01195, partial [bacterium]|nr:hypothetical protein [bacterium]
MNYNQIAKAIQESNLSQDELRNLNELVIEASKAKRSMAALSIKQSLSVGMSVMVDHPSHKSTVFTVEKINRTKIVITDSRGRRMNAPLSMV